MNFVDVFNQLRNVAIVARKCPTPVLQAAYITAYRDWCAQTQWLRMAVPATTTANATLYNIGADPLVEVIAINAMSVTYTAVPSGGPQTLPVYASDSGGWSPNAPTGLPRQYAYVPEGQFALYPTPSQTFNLNITVCVQPVDNAARVPDTPLRKYSTELEAGALARLLLIPNEPWTDPIRAAYYDRVYTSGISNGKAEVQRNFNSGAQRVRPRAFLI